MSDDDSRSAEDKFQAGVTDSIRKAVFGGISSLFMRGELKGAAWRVAAGCSQLFGRSD